MKKHRGFTLIELLVVIAIIGLLSAVVLASLNTAREKGFDASRETTLKNVQQAMELYADDNGGTYPVASSNWNSTCSSWNQVTQNNVIPGLAPTYIASEPAADPESNGVSVCCYLYRSTVNGSDYKFMLYNCPTSKACYGSGINVGLQDPLRPTSACAVYSGTGLGI